MSLCIVIKMFKHISTLKYNKGEKRETCLVTLQCCTENVSMETIISIVYLNGICRYVSD
jgi:hypothetical protein